MKRILIAMALVVALATVGGQSALAGTVPPSKVSGKLVTTTTGATTTGGTTTPGVTLTTSPTGSSKYTKYCPKDGGKDGRCPAPVTLPPQQILVTPPVVPSVLILTGCPTGAPDCTAILNVVGFPPSTPVEIIVSSAVFGPVEVAFTTTDVNGMVPIQFMPDGLCAFGPVTVTVSTTSGTPITQSTTVC